MMSTSIMTTPIPKSAPSSFTSLSPPQVDITSPSPQQHQSHGGHRYKKKRSRGATAQKKLSSESEYDSVAQGGVSMIGVEEATGSIQDEIVTSVKTEPKSGPRSIVRKRHEKNHRSNNSKKNQSRGDPKQEPNNTSTLKDDSTASTVCKGKEVEIKKPKSSKMKTKSKRFTWRKFVPPGTVDPITLESIVSLSYPPFAIAAEEPWNVVPIWPTPSTIDAALVKNEEKTQEKKITKENVNLYDGRALAYYLVSQLSFIDPLNRRDLTRPELVNLDRYLQRHSLGRAHVVEAYDNLGMTKSRAGVAFQTAQGRAELLQMEARSVMQALFSATYENRQLQGRRQDRVAATEAHGRHITNTTEAAAAAEVNQFCSDFQQMFLGQRGQVSHNESEVNHAVTNTSSQLGHDGITDYEEGFVIMDDDHNPSLRGRSYRDVMSHASLDATRVMQSQPVSDTFPSLSETYTTADLARPTVSAVPSSSSKPLSKTKGPSQSLKTIATMVQKTNPKELERQRKATEEAQRRAELSAFSCIVPDVMPRTQSAPTLGFQPSDALIERNQRLANALGVMPSTMRPNTIQRDGWARPIESQCVLDDFGNELNWIHYPLPLISQAKEHFEFILKLEKRWISFLKDDTSPSLSLRPMVRPLRKIAHEYSDFWKLQTESFDSEPKRYIHCVKLRDTQAPRPLLSEAVKFSRSSNAPPRLVATATLDSPVKSTEPLVSSVLSSSSLPTVERAIPLPPRSTSVPQGAIFERDDLVAKISALVPHGLPLSITATPNFPVNPNSRFSGLDRPRQKLNLAPRTIPQELPPFEVGLNNKIPQREQEKQAKRKVREAINQDIIAKAFESESDSLESSSDWEVGEAKYGSSSDENELW
jgi:hypothetical protein